MNVTLNKTDSVNAAIVIEVVKADYASVVENSLKDLRKNAVIDGFRKGMVPPSLLRQKYGKSILAEKLNELISQSLSDFIQEKTLNILGEPLQSVEQPSIDFDKQEDFVFIFDVGLSPDIDVRLTKDDTMPYYLIQVTDEMIDKQIDHYRARYGNRDLAEDVEEKDLVKGKLIELDENGEPKTDGITQEDAVLLPSYIKNEEEKAKFLNAKLNSALVFNPYKAYEGNETELASFLKVKKEDTGNYTNDFSFEITEISRYKSADLNQELFDKIYEPGTVDSEEAFRKKTKEYLARQLTPESDYKFILDVRDLLNEKATDMLFPDAFLKRWLLVSDPKRTPESVEEEYPKIVDDLKFHLIKEHLIEENKITVDESEMLDYAKQMAVAQFSQYGMDSIPEDLLENYSKEMLKKKETYRSLGDKAFEEKLIKILKEQVTLDFREISLEEYKKMVS